jgi:signal transduction histidine kinase
MCARFMPPVQTQLLPSSLMPHFGECTALMTRLISEMATSQIGLAFHLTSLNPLRPENAADAWEKKSLAVFEKGTTEVVGVEQSADGDVFRYMAPLRVSEPCMPCHAHQGYRVGDIRGGISVTQPYEAIDAATRAGVRLSTWTHAGVFVLVAALGWLLLELLRKRWFELAGKIRELEDTRGELVHSEKMASLGRMVAGFAHEINTPVGVAVGAVSQHDETLNTIEKMLTQDEVNEDALRAELASLRQGGALALSNLQRAAKLVQSFKRTSIDQASDEVRDFDMKTLISDVLFTLHNVLKRLPIQVTVDCADDLALHGTPGLLEQLLTNLVMNVTQHAFDNGTRAGTLRISATRHDSQVHLACVDDGTGMQPDQVARVFEPFYTTRRGEGGSGLGLYICYNIATTQLGGTITCESAPNAGCRFDIHFPAQFVATTPRVSV